MTTCAALRASRVASRGSSRPLRWTTSTTPTTSATTTTKTTRYYHCWRNNPTALATGLRAGVGSGRRSITRRCPPARRLGMADYKGWDPSQGIRFAPALPSPPLALRGLHTTPAVAATRGAIDWLDEELDPLPPLPPLPPLDNRGRVVGVPVPEKPKAKTTRAKSATTTATSTTAAAKSQTGQETGWETAQLMQTEVRDWAEEAVYNYLPDPEEEAREKKARRSAAAKKAAETRASNRANLLAAALHVAVGDKGTSSGTPSPTKATTTETAAMATSGTVVVGGKEGTKDDSPQPPPRAASPENAASDTPATAATTTTSATKTTKTATATRWRATRKAKAGEASTADAGATLPPREPKPPQTGLPFDVNEAKWNAARAAVPGTPESYFSYKLYEGPAELPSEAPVPVPVHYCRTLTEMEEVCTKYFAHEKVVGVDLEWMTYFPPNRKFDPRWNVSLIQLSSATRIALFHLALFKSSSASDGRGSRGSLSSIPGPDDLIAPTFRAMMGDPSIYKLGVCILGDTSRLKTHLNVETNGSFELSHLWKVVRYQPYPHLHAKVNRSPKKLADQVEDILGLPMFKDPSVRASNWMLPLTEAQIEYSATDAFAYIQLFHMLETERMSMQPPPPRPGFAETKQPLCLGLVETIAEIECTQAGDLADTPEGEALSGAATAEDAVAEDSEDIEAEALAVDPSAQEAEPLADEVASVDSSTQDTEPVLANVPAFVPDVPNFQETILVAEHHHIYQDVSLHEAPALVADEYHDSSSFEVWHDVSAQFANPDTYRPDTYESYEGSYDGPSGLYHDAHAYSPDVQYAGEYGAPYESFEGFEYVPGDSPLPPPVASEYEPAESVTEVGTVAEVAYESAPAPEPVPETEPETELELVPEPWQEPTPDPVPESKLGPDVGFGSRPTPPTRPAPKTTMASSPRPAPKTAPASSPQPKSTGGSKLDSVQHAQKSSSSPSPSSSSSSPSPPPSSSSSSSSSPSSPSSSSSDSPPSSKPPPIPFKPINTALKDPRVILAENLTNEYVHTYHSSPSSSSSATTDSSDPDSSDPDSSDPDSSDPDSSDPDSSDPDPSDTGSSDPDAPTKRATRVALRAYFLWRANRDLSPASIGELLRDPPLSPRTVASYVSQAVRRDRLPYEPMRFHVEIMSMIPKSLWKKARPNH